MDFRKYTNTQILAGVSLVVIVLVTTSVVITTSVLTVQNNSDSIENDAAVEEIEFERDLAQVHSSDLENHAENLNIDENTTLSQAEIDDLLYMREEEKLAGDVYLALYEIWGQDIFSNIASSEQQHTNSLKTLIDAYNLADPYIEGEGNFTNEDLSKLFKDLVAQGSQSIEDAFKVGALIEDLDIVDLEEAMTRTSNESILAVYENLQRGSRNHLRSFSSSLSRYGEVYQPQYLSEEEYLEIVAGAHEKGSGGNGKNGGRNAK